MESSSIVSEAVGTTAAVLTTVAFVPQAVRTWRLGGEGLSWAMLALFGSGVGLWFVYGFLRSSGPLVLANGVTGIQIGLIVWAKLFRRATSSPKSLDCNRRT